MRRRRAGSLGAPSSRSPQQGCESVRQLRLASLLFVLRSGETRHVLTVRIREITDPLAALAGMRPGVLHRAAESDIVAKELISAWLGGQVIDVGLLHLEVSRRVAAVVWLVSIGHVRLP